jgi:hypothetical protein
MRDMLVDFRPPTLEESWNWTMDLAPFESMHLASQTEVISNIDGALFSSNTCLEQNGLRMSSSQES